MIYAAEKGNRVRLVVDAVGANSGTPHEVRWHRSDEQEGTIVEVVRMPNIWCKVKPDHLEEHFWIRATCLTRAQ